MVQIENIFSKLGLNSFIVKSLHEMGYIKPSPIQKACIPYLLSGKDVLGMAQTGSGKTAAFSLPLLQNIILNLRLPQVLVLTPTRELAIQVAESFSEFSKYIKGVKVLALYGGQRYELQLRALRQGPQIVVGTPGRLLDHLRRGTLNLSNLKGLVLDEADEMLRMGFIEDVETIMTKIPSIHQTALFSATMPEVIRRISKRFMTNPKEVKIKSNIMTRPNIKQTYWIVCGKKTDGLIRFLESEDFSATIIFVRTKNATLEVSEALEKNGYNSAALNGDMNQTLREQTLERLKNGRLDILIATDVAARGLDVDRISLVINYDIPMDVESYIHRIGRTGRAGRPGQALLFVENRERRLLRNIERAVQHPILEVLLPDVKLLSKCRLEKFLKKISFELKSKDLNKYCDLLKEINSEKKIKIEILAAILLKMAQGDRPLIIPNDRTYPTKKQYLRNTKKQYINKNSILKKKQYLNTSLIASKNNTKSKLNMIIYRIEVGSKDGVEVRHIVGAIANEGNINSRNIGNVKIFAQYSTVELSKNINKEILKNLFRTRILNKPIKLKLCNSNSKYLKNNSFSFKKKNDKGIINKLKKKNFKKNSKYN